MKCDKCIDGVIMKRLRHSGDYIAEPCECLIKYEEKRARDEQKWFKMLKRDKNEEED
tara:strand:+ start:588 stop:758 length:171 start_codon:yes stop_codon:yes gene_type:complete